MMDQLSLFDNRETTSPLASRIRPDTLDGFVGQKHLIGEGKVLRNLIEKDQVTSMIFWGPPGVGKTTLARIIAGKTRSSFIDFSAVTSGIKEIKTVMEQAEKNRSMGIRTILFVDEIHRFNKAQQDAFLPYVEKGSIILIGATTENPSFEINSALLSRCKVFVLKALTAEELAELLAAVVKSPKGFGNQHVQISKEQLFFIANFANGDARTALNTLEMAVLNGELDRSGTLSVTNQVLEQCTNKKSLLYDKKGEEHYNLISALHRCRRLLAGPNAGGRRRPALCGPQTDPFCQRGYRNCRSSGLNSGCGRLSGLPLHRNAGMHPESDSGSCLHGHGAEIKFDLQSL